RFSAVELQVVQIFLRLHGVVHERVLGRRGGQIDPDRGGQPGDQDQRRGESQTSGGRGQHPKTAAYRVYVPLGDDEAALGDAEAQAAAIARCAGTLPRKLARSTSSSRSARSVSIECARSRTSLARGEPAAASTV